MKSQTTNPVEASNDNISTRSRFNPIHSVQRWFKINGVVKTLQELDDRTLEDIGVNRHQIIEVARRTVDGKSRPAA